MMLDSRDNVWISTFDGLNRYDGSKINVYYHVDDDANSLSHNSCTSLFELEPGRVMVGHDKGVQIYSYDTDGFSVVPLILRNSDTISAHVTEIIRRKDNTVICCTSHYGLFCYDGSFFRELETPGMESVPIGMMEDATGRLWLFDSQGDVFVNAQYVGHVSGIKKLLSSTSGRVYACSSQEGLRYFDTGNHVFAAVPGYEMDCQLWTARAIDDDRLLLCTDGSGLWVYDEVSDACFRPEIRTYEYSFEHSNVKDALVDSFGNIWVGVFWRGVIVQPAELSAFQYIGRRSASRNTIGNNCVTSIAVCEGADSLWVGTDHGGLYQICSDGSGGRHYGADELQGMPSTVMKVFQDRSSNIWIGTSVEGVFIMDRKRGKCISLDDLTGSTSKLFSCFDMIQDSDNSIWLASNGSGLYRLSENSGRWELRDYSRLLNNEYARALLIHGDLLYVGTSNGLDIIHKSDSTLESKFHVLTKSSVNCLKMSIDGTVLVATNTGLYRLRCIDNTVEILNRYYSGNGLSNDMVLAMEQVQGGKLWVSTDRGLSLIDLATGAISIFSTSDGLQYEQFSGRASVNCNGRLYFGGINGIAMFRNSSHLYDTGYGTIPGKVRIVSLTIGGNSVNVCDRLQGKVIIDDWISVTQSVRLPLKFNTFGLELSTMNVCETHPVYSYSVDGKEWVNLASGQHHINFTALKSGTHSISVREQGSGECSIRVRVLPAWYESPVAIVSFIVLVVSVVVLALLLRKQHRKAIIREAEHLQKVEEEREIHKQEVERVRNFRRVEELDVDSPDDLLMRRVMAVINSNLSNTELDVEFIASHVGLSRVQLYRRIKEITDMTPHEFLSDIRFKEAKRLLSENSHDITDISEALGFKSLSSFSSAFKSYTGMTPTDYMKNSSLLKDFD